MKITREGYRREIVPGVSRSDAYTLVVDGHRYLVSRSESWSGVRTMVLDTETLKFRHSILRER